MKKNIWIKVLCALLLLATSACKTKKNIASLPNTANNPQKKSVMAQLMDADLTFSTYSTKAKTHIKIDSSTYDINLNIRIKRNDTIWISVSYFGIEGGRVLITPDSIKMLNRLQSQYLVKPFSYLSKYAHAKVDFNALQSIFTGNIMAFCYGNEASISKDSSGYTIRGFKWDLSYQAKFNNLTKIVETILSDSKLGQQLQINYANFIPSNKTNIPTQVVLKTTANQKTITASMLYTIPQIDKKLDFPFTIPKRFSAVE
jgi:hypothetical protein